MYQPRYQAYATAHGRAPAAQMRHDQAAYPGGKMVPFILWMDRKWQEWRQVTGEYPPHSPADHAEFDQWLRSDDDADSKNNHHQHSRQPRLVRTGVLAQ